MAINSALIFSRVALTAHSDNLWKELPLNDDEVPLVFHYFKYVFVDHWCLINITPD